MPDSGLGHTTLLTNLANRVQPLIRYDLGDRITPHRQTVPARGSALPRLDVQGRTDALLTLRDARHRAVRLAPPRSRNRARGRRWCLRFSARADGRCRAPASHRRGRRRRSCRARGARARRSPAGSRRKACRKCGSRGLVQHRSAAGRAARCSALSVALRHRDSDRVPARQRGGAVVYKSRIFHSRQHPDEDTRAAASFKSSWPRRRRLSPPARASPQLRRVRNRRLKSTCNTGERLDVEYWSGSLYRPDATAAVNRLLRLPDGDVGRSIHARSTCCMPCRA